MMLKGRLALTLHDQWARLRSAWVKRILKRPIIYRDQFGIVNELRPHENLRYVIGLRSHLDDLGLAKALRQLVTPGMTVIDVGANKGDFTLHAARLAMPGGIIYAFEPLPYAYAYLETTLQRFAPAGARVKSLPQAVGDHTGTVDMLAFPPEYFSHSSLYPEGGLESVTQHPEAVVRAITVVSVPLITLDDFCRDNGISVIDLLKVDVEGFEPEVFAGSSNLLRTGAVKRLIFEISREPLRRRGIALSAVVEPLLTLDYTIERIAEDGRIIPLDNPHDESAYPYFANYLAMPPH